MAAENVTTRASKGSALTHTEMDTNWTNLQGGLVYVGSILLWPSTTLPDSKWLEMAGQGLSTGSYPDLFTLIGYTYGGSGGTFYLPDTRGYFIRGFNHGAGTDPDASSRTDRGDGTAGDNIGTKQSSQVGPHNHTSYVAGANFLYSAGGGNPNVGIPYQTGAPNTTTSETRPTNIQLMYIIKALK